MQINLFIIYDKLYHLCRVFAPNLAAGRFHRGKMKAKADKVKERPDCVLRCVLFPTTHWKQNRWSDNIIYTKAQRRRADDDEFVVKGTTDSPPCAWKNWNKFFQPKRTERDEIEDVAVGGVWVGNSLYHQFSRISRPQPRRPTGSGEQLSTCNSPTTFSLVRVQFFASPRSKCFVKEHIITKKNMSFCKAGRYDKNIFMLCFF